MTQLFYEVVKVPNQDTPVQILKAVTNSVINAYTNKESVNGNY